MKNFIIDVSAILLAIFNIINNRTKKTQILKPHKTLEIEAIKNYFQFNKIHDQTLRICVCMHYMSIKRISNEGHVFNSY